ncbi:MAG TPA: HD domain-containing protein [Roseiflexaceae bacterium]|nr:HD domain-containing protein [Roseiflexaceae bacterium]
MQHAALQRHIADLLAHPKVLETQEHMHHSISKHDHLMRSVKYSYRFARLLRADLRICARAALIHDIDSRLGTLTTHGAVAARWAAEQGECERVQKAIVSHMFPFGPAPETREAWVLVLADKAATLGDLKQFVRGLLNGTSLANRRRLKQSDPFYRTRPRPLLRRLSLLQRKQAA